MIVPVPTSNTFYGTDPEIFVRHHGKIVGCERVIPPLPDGTGNLVRYPNSIALDGVQMELHPGPAPDIYELGRGVANSMKLAVSAMRNAGDGQFKVDLSQVVRVDDEELQALSLFSRRLGCAPSDNFYKDWLIDVPDDFPMRSAAGHIHVGVSNVIWSRFNTPPLDYRRCLVPLFDILVGNQCVLMDRDPMAKERRKLYGHAGEFRINQHGIEYRTPSNFWLKSFGLFELTFGLTKMAVSVLHSRLSNGGREEALLLEAVNLKKIVRAIEKNDAKLAMENWQSIREYIRNHFHAKEFAINSVNVDEADTFFQVAAQDKLTPFLPADPVRHWTDDVDHMEQPQYSWGPVTYMTGRGNRWADLRTKVLKAHTPQLP